MIIIFLSPKFFFFFEKNEKERNKEFDKLKEELNIKYNINNPNAIKLDSILLFKFLNGQKKENKYIELLDRKSVV